MQERLIIKNFGPIKDVDLGLRQTTIFIGEQASGKSTLAKLIGIFRRPQVFDINKNEEELYIDFQYNLNDIGLLNFFNEETTINYMSDAMEIVIISKSINIVKNNWFEKEYKDIFKLFYKLSLNAGLSELKSEKKRANLIFETIKNSPEKLEKLIYAIDNTAIPVYIPAERILIPTIAKSLFSLIDTNTNLPKAITGFGNNFEKARSFYKKHKIDFLGIEYKYIDNQDFIFDNEVRLELFQSSSGLQSIIPMILVINHYKERNINVHFIVEEPELNLYPTTQHDLMKFILSKCQGENNQLTITTHSPYNLSTLNVLLLAYQTGQKDEEATNKVIPKASWVNPDHFNAYFVEKGGTVRQIFDRETGMIAENELDNVSLTIGDEFDTLMDIYSSVSA